MTTYSTDRNCSAGLLYALKKLGRPNISLKKSRSCLLKLYMIEKMSLFGFQLNKFVALYASTKSLHN